MTVTIDQARTAKAKLQAQLRTHANVVGIGIGRDGPSYCVKVNLQRDDRGGLPEDVDGVRVRYEVVGSIRPVGRPIGRPAGAG
ncbi:MAG: hypothetical protein AB7K86_20320 [Rhodospirillales bacterium]